MRILGKKIVGVIFAVWICAAAMTFACSGEQSTKNLYRSQLTGLSMFPTIKCGEFVYYEKTSVSELKEGDIVVFQDRMSGQRVCHRVLSVESDFVYVKGDNNRFRDKESVGDDNLLGRVAYINRHPV